MPSDKRQRQREGRQERAHQTTRLTKRQQRTRQLRTLGIIIILVLVAGLLVSLFAGGGDEEVSTDDTAADDTTADDTTTTSGGPTTTVVYSNPELAAEVLGRDPPKPEGPPVDLAKDALEVETLIEGQGDAAIKSGDTVVVHYVGVLPEGAEFDESWSKGAPFTTPIGTGQVIAGWDEGMVGAKIGERRRLVIGSDKAYGAAGQGSIPPDSPLAFEIDVVDITPAAG